MQCPDCKATLPLHTYRHECDDSGWTITTKRIGYGERRLTALEVPGDGCNAL
jgi:hypothetical protein